MDRGAEKLQIFLWSALGAFTLAGQLFWEPLFLSGSASSDLISTIPYHSRLASCGAFVSDQISIFANARLHSKSSLRPMEKWTNGVRLPDLVH